jgi:hypothetical protein
LCLELLELDSVLDLIWLGIVSVVAKQAMKTTVVLGVPNHQNLTLKSQIKNMVMGVIMEVITMGMVVILQVIQVIMAQVIMRKVIIKAVLPIKMEIKDGLVMLLMAIQLKWGRKTKFPK